MTFQSTPIAGTFIGYHLSFLPSKTAQIGDKIGMKTHIEFTGKETDCETGFSYFGARYYDPTLLTSWTAVDPMADKYPNLSPYNYCAWNPIKLVDPNGDTVILSATARKIHQKYYNGNYPEYVNAFNQLSSDKNNLFVFGEINDIPNASGSTEGGTIVEIYPEEGEAYSDFSGNVYSVQWGSPQAEYGGTEDHVFLEELFHAKQVLDYGNNEATIDKEYKAKAFAIRINTAFHSEVQYPGDKKGRWGYPTQLGQVALGEYEGKKFLKQGGTFDCQTNIGGIHHRAVIPGAYSKFPDK